MCMTIFNMRGVIYSRVSIKVDLAGIIILRCTCSNNIRFELLAPLSKQQAIVLCDAMYTYNVSILWIQGRD